MKLQAWRNAILCLLACIALPVDATGQENADRTQAFLGAVAPLLRADRRDALPTLFDDMTLIKSSPSLRPGEIWLVEPGTAESARTGIEAIEHHVTPYAERTIVHPVPGNEHCIDAATVLDSLGLPSLRETPPVPALHGTTPDGVRWHKRIEGRHNGATVAVVATDASLPCLSAMDIRPANRR